MGYRGSGPANALQNEPDGADVPHAKDSDEYSEPSVDVEHALEVIRAIHGAGNKRKQPVGQEESVRSKYNAEDDLQNSLVKMSKASLHREGGSGYLPGKKLPMRGIVPAAKRRGRLSQGRNAVVRRDDRPWSAGPMIGRGPQGRNAVVRRDESPWCAGHECRRGK